MESAFQKCVESPMSVCLYFAAVLVLLVLMVFYLKQLVDEKPKSEHIIGSGLGTARGTMQASAGGPSIRFQEFSSPITPDRQTVHTIDVAEVAPELSRTGRPVDFGVEYSEHLVNNRGEPDFWTIGNELSSYKRSQTTGMRSDAAAAQHESFSDSPLDRIRRKEMDDRVPYFQ